MPMHLAGLRLRTWLTPAVRLTATAANRQLPQAADRPCNILSALAGFAAAGYPEATCQFIEDVMMGRNIPDPQTIRKFDLVGPLGMIDYRLLEQARILQVGGALDRR